MNALLMLVGENKQPQQVPGQKIETMDQSQMFDGSKLAQVPENQAATIQQPSVADQALEEAKKSTKANTQFSFMKPQDNPETLVVVPKKEDEQTAEDDKK